jgi:hypothetical protein
MIQSIGLIATAWFLMTISVSPGLGYGAPWIWNGCLLARIQAARLLGADMIGDMKMKDVGMRRG